MPTSLHNHLSKMVDWIVRVRPTSVLDVGVGHGKWGFLAREFTDIFHNRYGPAEWEVRIDGIEAFAAYKTPTYDYIYNNIYYGDARDVLPGLPGYDLAVVGDVIEHFTKEDGRALLAHLRKHCSYVLLSSPTWFFQQEVMGNPFETHKSLWTCADFEGLDFEYDEVDNTLFVALVRGERAGGERLELGGRASAAVYARPWLKRRPKLAQIAKKYVRRVPGYRPR